jgi:hypothetical protein
MKHMVPHDLPFDLAKKAADAALQSYKQRFPDYDPQVTWSDEKTANVALKAKGMSMRGIFEINPDNIAMDMEVPLLLRPFKQKALDVIEEQIKMWIAKAKSGELK